jgi:hypothetical protein
MPHTFGNDERVAAKDDRDVMVPAGKASAFVVVEPELVFEILVGALGSPALHHHPYQSLLGEALGKGTQEAVRRQSLPSQESTNMAFQES